MLILFIKANRAITPCLISTVVTILSSLFFPFFVALCTKENWIVLASAMQLDFLNFCLNNTTIIILLYSRQMALRAIEGLRAIFDNENCRMPTDASTDR